VKINFDVVGDFDLHSFLNDFAEPAGFDGY
jgi:hypothetical protein